MKLKAFITCFCPCCLVGPSQKQLLADTRELGSETPRRAAGLRTTGSGPSLPGKSPMDCGHLAERSEISGPGAEPSSLLPSAAGSNSCPPVVAGQRAGGPPGRPAAANAARERSRVQTLRHAFLELQKTLPSVPPDTKLSKLDVLLLATTYIAHLTRSLQDEEESPGEGLGTLRGDGYLHPVKVGELRSSCHLLSVKKYIGLRYLDESKVVMLAYLARVNT
ncbi:transcription factor 24 isoform X1 [Falco rusticolus]|uniref:transcription factor 24 isoform X1 n=1 Tax=Falco rusticolus TaxID=120794 RepID=UPI001886846D|nr:transcription factor 24 isoform X1 [Falco rusticolus]XP_055561810.1 transcription factor 24 isoform X1 [Falco cherrug]